MEQFKKLLADLSIMQRVTIVAAALVVGAGIFAFVQWKRESDFRPLYTALASEDAGAVVQKLREGGVDFRLSESGSTVLVPSAKLAEMRLEMAAAGLPKSGRIGFELFDKTNFGATEFVEHINYRRALEGELERTVMSLAEVEQARVHVTFPKESVYLESRQPARASVVVHLRPGATLLPQNVVAIEHLVASAVEGFTPEAVSVLDVRGNLLSRVRAAAAADGAESSDRLLEIRQGIERDLVAKINSTLEPLLGANKFRAGAAVECDFSSGEQSEELFDPNRSVVVTSQKSEDTSTTGKAAGVPGTASTLPRPATPKPSDTPVPSATWLPHALDKRHITIGGAFAIAFLLVVVRRVFAKMLGRKGKVQASAPPTLPSGDGDAEPALEAQRRVQLAEQASLQAQIDAAAFREATKKSAVLVKRLRENI